MKHFKKIINLKDFKNALKMAFSSRSLLVRGFLFSMNIPFLSIFTNPMALGYTVRVGAGMMRGEKKLTEWKKGFRFWIDAMAVGFILILYIALPFFILLGIKQLVPSPMFENFDISFLEGLFSDSGKSLFSSEMSVLEKIIIILAFAPFLYVVPVVGINWFSSRKFFNSFDVDLIWKRVFRREYLVASVVSFLVVYFVPLFIGSLLSLFSFFNGGSLPEIIKSYLLGESYTSPTFLLAILFLLIIFVVVGVVSYGISLFVMIVHGQALRKIDKKDFKKNKNKAKALYLADLDTLKPKAGEGR